MLSCDSASQADLVKLLSSSRTKISRLVDRSAPIDVCLLVLDPPLHIIEIKSLVTNWGCKHPLEAITHVVFFSFALQTKSTSSVTSSFVGGSLDKDLIFRHEDLPLGKGHFTKPRSLLWGWHTFGPDFNVHTNVKKYKYIHTLSGQVSLTIASFME